MDYKIVHMTLQGKCVSCGKRAPDCTNWEQCYERRLMTHRGYGDYSVCVLCGDGFGTRDKLQHAGACLARYLRRVDELRDLQDDDRLIPYAGRARAAGGNGETRPSLPRPSVTHDGPGALGDLPASLAKMYPRFGMSQPGTQKSMTFVTGRPKTVRVTVKDKGVQAQEKTKDKSTQTTAIELEPGQDVAYVRWTGLAQTRRPLLEMDRARIYGLIEGLRRAVADVLGGEEFGAVPDGQAEEQGAAAIDGGPENAVHPPNLEDSFASAERRIGEIEEILNQRTLALERAMRPPSSADGSSDPGTDGEPDGSMAVAVGSPLETSPVASGEPEDGTDESEDSVTPETEANNSFASAVSGDTADTMDTGLSEDTESSGHTEDSDRTSEDPEDTGDDE